MKKIKYLIVGSAFLGALSGTIPPMFINASSNPTNPLPSTTTTTAPAAAPAATPSDTTESTPTAGSDDLPF